MPFDMSRSDAEEYTQALGQVVAGGWRQVALGQRLGVPAALGISTQEWVEQRLGGYVRLSIPDRRDAVAELTEEGMSSREVGDVLGVDQKTVVNDRHAEEVSSPEPDTAPELSAVEPIAEEVSSPEPIDESARIAAERDRRITAWASSIRSAIETLAPMVGHPVPAELKQKLAAGEYAALTQLVAPKES